MKLNRAIERRTGNRQRAFTLIELMLAIGICAVVLVAINGVFFAGLRLRAKTHAALDRALPIDHALNLMRQDLQNALPPAGQMIGPLQSGALNTESSVDEASAVQFFTTTGALRPEAPWADVQKVSYQLQTPADSDAVGKDLVRSVTRNLLPANTEEIEEQWLAGGIENMSFSYYDGASWQPTWEMSVQTNLPLAVRVVIQLANDSKAGSPGPEPLQLLVPLMAQSRSAQIDTNAVANTQ